MRADIDYGFYEARTTFGRIGVKVWIYKGDVTARELAQQQAAAPRPSRGPRREGADRPARARRERTDAPSGVTENTAEQAPAAEATAASTEGEQS
jgi:small subunit ribosomal protein S3